MSKNTDQPKICKNPHCFEDTCKGECKGEPLHLDNGLSEDGEFIQYFEHTPLRSKYLYDGTPSSSKS